MKRLDTIYRRAQDTLKKPQVRRRIKWGAVVFLIFNLLAWLYASYFVTRPNIAKAAAPTYKASGTFTAGTGAITPPYPTGGSAPVANDIALLVVTSENQAISLTTANGFVEVGAQANKAAGTAATDPASRMAVYWKRSTGGDAAPEVADSGNNTEGQIHLFSGVITSGNPWDVYGEGNDSAVNDTSGVIPGASTTVVDTLVVLLNSSSYNGTSTAQFSAWANGGLTSLTERADNTNTTGLGGGHGMATGERASTGAYGNTTVTLAQTSYKGAMSIALKPQPAAPLLTQSGYHWRNNDGGEADATSKTGGSENTSITANKNVVQRLRMQVSNEGTASHTGASFRIEYAQTATCSSGTYTPIPVTPTTEHFNMADSTYVTDGTATTNIAVSTGGVTDANTTFDAGQFKDAGNTTSSIALTTTEFTELEYSFLANDNAQWDTTYCFRVTDNGTALDAYTQYAQLTMASQPPNLEQVHYRWRNDNGPEQGSPTDANEGPSGNEVVVTGWTNPGNAYSLTDDNTYATAAPAKNQNVSSNFTTFGFDSSLPSNATINAVTLVAQYNVSTQSSIADLTVVPVVSGSDCGSGGNDTSEPLSDYDFSTNVTSCRSWTRDDLLDANFKVRVNAHRGNSNTAVTFSLDMVKVTVNYSLPGATFKKDEDTPHSGQAKNENIRLRALIKNTGGTISQGYKVQYVSKSAACNTISSGWVAIPITASTEHFEFTTSSNFTDQDSTLNINPGLSDPAGTFVAGYLTEDPSYMSNAVSLTNGDFTELEYNFQANDSASGTYCFRLVRGTSETELDIYTAYPELGIAGGNNPPNTPTNLGPAGYIDASGWMNDNTPTFNFDVTDPDPSEQVKYRIQIDDTSGFGSPVLDYQPSSYGTEGTYNYTVGQAGSYAVGSESMTLSDSAVGGGYYWRVKAIDDDLAESAYEEAGVDGTIDFRVDATAPTGGVVNDGTGSDADYNDGSLNTLSANWSGVDSSNSGLQKYEYAIGTTQGGTDVVTWTDNGTGTSVTKGSLTLRTSQKYYFSVRTTDNASNVSTPINSNGQEILPQISFTINTSSITFDNLNNANNYTDTQTGSFTTSTNAYNGYTVRAYITDLLRSLAYPSITIANFQGTYSAPETWSPPGDGKYGFGYGTSDCDVNSGLFWSGPSCTGSQKFAAFTQTASGDTIADHFGPITGSPITNEIFTITYRVAVQNSQTASTYRTYATYIVVPNF